MNNKHFTGHLETNLELLNTLKDTHLDYASTFTYIYTNRNIFKISRFFSRFKIFITSTLDK